jgi:hypothetical protein
MRSMALLVPKAATMAVEGCGREIRLEDGKTESWSEWPK